MFWGIILKPDTKYKTKVEKAFRVSQAALELKKSDVKSCVKLLYKDLEFILCYLDSQKNIQVSLDLSFERGEIVTLVAEGTGVVHLTGLMEDDSDDEEEEDDAYDISNLKAVGRMSGKKWKLGDDDESAMMKPVSKKMKSLMPPDSDEDDEDDDSDIEGDSGDLEFDDDEGDSEDMMEEGDSDVENALESFDEDDEDDEDDEEDEDGEDDEEAAPVVKKVGKAGKQKPAAERKGDQEEQPLSKKQKKREKKKERQRQTREGPGTNTQKQGTPKHGDQPKADAQKAVNGDAQESGKKKKKNKKKNKENEPKAVIDSKSPAAKDPPNSAKKSQNKSGVLIDTLKPGSGPIAKSGKTVHVYYRGRLKSNNKEFDKMTEGKGFRFRLGAGEVIKGWDIGVDGMAVGEKRRLTVPANLAYGKEGVKPSIPSNAELVFDVELKAVS